MNWMKWALISSSVILLRVSNKVLNGALLADEAIVTTNPEVSSVRDSDRILGILDSKSRRSEDGLEPVKTHLLLTRYNPARVTQGEMLC